MASRLYPGFGSGKGAYEEECEVKSFEAHGMPELENGDKVILPQAAFREISRLKLPFPMIFRVENGKRRSSGKVASRAGKTPKEFRQFCGVQEFSAKRGTAIMPKWMMRNLKIRDGGRAFFTSIRGMPKGKFVRFQPHTTEFIDLAAALGPRELMEHAMKTYSALSVGETIVIECSGSRFKLDVVETKPGPKDEPPNTTGGICLYGDLDLEADFAPAKDTLPDPSATEDTPISGAELDSLAAQALAAASAGAAAPAEETPSGAFHGEGRSLGGGAAASRPSSARRLRERIAASRHAGGPRAMSPIQASPVASPSLKARSSRRTGAPVGGGALRSTGSQRSMGSTTASKKPLRKAASERNVRGQAAGRPDPGRSRDNAPPAIASPGFKPDASSSSARGSRGAKPQRSTGTAKSGAKRPTGSGAPSEGKQAAAAGPTQPAAPVQSFGLGFYSGRWSGVDLGTPPSGITRLQRAAVAAMGADATVQRLFASPRSATRGGGFTDEGGNILAETAARDLAGTARMLGAHGASTSKFHAAGAGHTLHSPAPVAATKPRVSPVTGGAAAGGSTADAAGLRLGGAASPSARHAGRAAMLQRLEARQLAAATASAIQDGKEPAGQGESKYGTPPRASRTNGRVSPIMSPGTNTRTSSSASRAAAQGRAVRQAAALGKK